MLGPMYSPRHLTMLLMSRRKQFLHPITYMSGLFRGSQIDWASLTKEAVTNLYVQKKFSFYLDDADNTF